MEGVRDRALAYARSQPLDLPGVLGKHVRDWHIIDSMTVKLPDDLIDEYRGTGDYVALKIHKRFSVGVGTTIGYHLSPAREHDALHLRLDESWRGLGLLCDLGYASMQLLRDCEQYNVRYVMRLKDSWKPKVLEVVRGTLTKTFVPGTDLDVLLDDEVLLLDGKVIDVDVALGPKGIPPVASRRWVRAAKIWELPPSTAGRCASRTVSVPARRSLDQPAARRQGGAAQAGNAARGGWQTGWCLCGPSPAGGPTLDCSSPNAPLWARQRPKADISTCAN